MEVDKNPESGSLTLQVKFVTKSDRYAVPDTPYVLDAKVTSDGLNALINQILKEDDRIPHEIEFDFLIGNEFLRGKLEELVLRHENSSAAEDVKDKPKIGVEETIEIEYLERTGAPEPDNVLLHDDWVSAVDSNDKWILTGSYDGTVHLWSTTGKHRVVIPAHSSPVKAVTWITQDESLLTFASASHDQTLMIWEWSVENNKVTCKAICKGHKRSVDTVKQDHDGQRIASGSWDGELKVWSGSSSETENSVGKVQNEEEDNSGKLSRAPIMTLAGHKESISCVNWSDVNEIVSSSWDHTIKLWDVETGGVTSEIAGNKAFFGLSWSDLNKTVVTCSADRHVRLYDPRSKEGSLVKAMFTSHSGWVSSVNWSKTNENLFISGSHDNLIKLWDRRSPRAPLYNMAGHTDKVLCTSWSNDEYIMGGGADNSLRIFKQQSS